MPPSAALERVRSPGPTSAARRLELAERLLSATDVHVCIRVALEWLVHATTVRRGLCLVTRPAENDLVVAGRLHVPAPRVAGLRVDLDVRDHPLVAALLGPGPVFLGPGEDGLGAAVAGGPWCAVTLPGVDAFEDLPAGLLLVAPATPDVVPDVTWVAGLLGPRLAGLRAAVRLLESERQLQRERTLLYGIINAVTDPVMVTDADGRIIIANARAEALFAAADDESEGRRRAIALNNMLFSAALSRNALGDPEPVRQELPLVDPSDGSDLLFELLTTVATDRRDVAGVVSILRNVTDLHRATEEIEDQHRKLRLAEAEAREERDRLDLIIDSVADPILVTDPAGNIVMMNAPAERLFTVDAGTSPEAQRSVQANDAQFSSFVSNLFFGDALRRTGELVLADPLAGAALPVEAIAGKIVSEQGEVTAVVTVLHDRREELERRRLYEELKKASAELEQKVREATAELVHQNELLRRSHFALEQASAAKSQFLANMSHEFRTPLNAILGYTSLLLKNIGGSLTTHQRRNLERIDANAQHLLAIVNDILDISRIEAGKMPLTLGEVDVTELIHEVLREVEPLIARSRLSVTTELAPDLPRIVSDRQKIKQIVINLLTNALKFTPEGSVTVRAAYQAKGDAVSLAVEDTGIGIAAKDQALIFEDFRQADNSPTRQYMGAGLGLAICRRLTTMLDGSLTVSSELGQGSVFVLTLPRVPNAR